MKPYLLFLYLILSLFSSCKHVRKVPYTVMEKVSVELTYSQERGEWNREDGLPGFVHPKLTGNCYITNTSAYDGMFKMHFVFNSQGDEVNFSSSEYVRAGERKLFSIEKDINHFTFQTNVGCKISVETPVIQVDQQVTKYKDEVYYSLF